MFEVSREGLKEGGKAKLLHFPAGSPCTRPKVSAERLQLGALCPGGGGAALTDIAFNGDLLEAFLEAGAGGAGALSGRVHGGGAGLRPARRRSCVGGPPPARAPPLLGAARGCGSSPLPLRRSLCCCGGRRGLCPGEGRHRGGGGARRVRLRPGGACRAALLGANGARLAAWGRMSFPLQGFVVGRMRGPWQDVRRELPKRRARGALRRLRGEAERSAHACRPPSTTTPLRA